MESSATSSIRRPFFRGGEDDGLASIAGFSGNNHPNTTNNNNHGYPVNHHQNQPFTCYNGDGGGGIMMRRRNSLRNITSLSPVSSPTRSVSARLFDARFEELHSPHFLESCHLCKKPLGGNRDIFLYRGDTPFCSEECRQEQIDIDESKEKNRKMKALRSKKEANKSSSANSSSSPSKTPSYPFRTGTVVAA
ncbi:hypothetical protein SOVF_160990 [Spinacia oleracea]|uniref:FCS-Like Zinc finger 1 n=1 Tax=Spinacia oleracea TaxID=3562 RepID=A0A9R0JP75_SPIOL|nr:FCS-Like Zinc finger 1 [Spinacia oleracea]KNA08617.1 hypothetical protein SOVF_160990 [Spinacia oleracea]